MNRQRKIRHLSLSLLIIILPDSVTIVKYYRKCNLFIVNKKQKIYCLKYFKFVSIFFSFCHFPRFLTTELNLIHRMEGIMNGNSFFAYKKNLHLFSSEIYTEFQGERGENRSCVFATSFQSFFIRDAIFNERRILRLLENVKENIVFIVTGI